MGDRWVTPDKRVRLRGKQWGGVLEVVGDTEVIGLGMGGYPDTRQVPRLTDTDKVTPSDAPYKRVCLRGGKSPVPDRLIAGTKDDVAGATEVACFECHENFDFTIRGFLPKVLYDES